MSMAIPLTAAAEKAARKRANLWFAVPVLLLMMGSATAYFQAFCDRKPFDDEGILTEWIRTALQGQRLYEQVHTFYGPAFFLYHELGNSILGGQPPTNDSIRFVAMFFWILSAASAFVLIRYAVTSWVLALGAYFLVFQTAGFLVKEPGHPQELILVLMIAAIIAAVGPWRNAWRMAMLGGIAAILTFTKANCGLFLILILGGAFASGWQTRIRYKPVNILCWLALVGFAPFLFLPNLGVPWAQRFLAIETCSLIAVLITIWPADSKLQFSLRTLAPCALGFAALTAAMVLVAVVQGSSVGTMVQWLFVKPRSALGAVWYVAPEIPLWYLAWAAGGILVALLARTGHATPARIASLKIAAGCGMVAFAAANRYGAILFLGPPFLWLIARPEAASPRIDAFARACLALTSAIFVLYAYPVAGVHVRLVDVLLILVGIMILGEGLSYAASLYDPSAVRQVHRFLAPAAAGVIVFFSALTLISARDNYLRLTPLNLPGAERLRVPDEEARGLQAITRQARQSCSFLVTLPSMMSFNHWASLPSISGVPFANWVTGYDDAAQNRVIRDIASASRPCIIENPAMIGFWTHNSDVSNRPIMVYVHQHFRELMEAEGNHLLIPAQAK